MKNEFMNSENLKIFRKWDNMKNRGKMEENRRKVLKKRGGNIFSDFFLFYLKENDAHLQNFIQILKK